ncbi:MAG: hypothetical protein ACJAT2_003532 [Bacteriovoracaceae bacterium]|jgi:hypothetical protein
MQLTKKINLKLFIPLSLGFTSAAALFAQSQLEIYVILGVYVATLLNLGMLLGVISKIILIGSSVEPVKYSKIMLAITFIGKMAVIFLALSLGVHFMGKRIIIPLLNYVIQIFVLGVSLRRTK